MFTAYARSATVFNSLQDKVAVTNARLLFGDNTDLHIAIIKATNHDEVPPKDKHVRALKQAVQVREEQERTRFILREFQERLKSQEWLIVLKTQIVIHRLIRETDSTFLTELMNFDTGNSILRVDNFTDKNQKENYDYSAFVRAFGCFLDARVQLYRETEFDSDHTDGEALINQQDYDVKMDVVSLLNKFLIKIISCVPEGKAQKCDVILKSVMAPLIKECMKVYSIVQKSLLSLMNALFEMNATAAKKCALVFRETADTHEQLQKYFSKISKLEIDKEGIHLPNLEPVPTDFLQQMDDYVRSLQKDYQKQDSIIQRQMSLVKEASKPGSNSSGRIQKFQTIVTSAAVTSQKTLIQSRQGKKEFKANDDQQQEQESPSPDADKPSSKHVEKDLMELISDAENSPMKFDNPFLPLIQSEQQLDQKQKALQLDPFISDIVTTPVKDYNTQNRQDTTINVSPVQNANDPFESFGNFRSLQYENSEIQQPMLSDPFWELEVKVPQQINQQGPQDKEAAGQIPNQTQGIDIFDPFSAITVKQQAQVPLVQQDKNKTTRDPFTDLNMQTSQEVNTVRESSSDNPFTNFLVNGSGNVQSQTQKGDQQQNLSTNNPFAKAQANGSDVDVQQLSQSLDPFKSTTQSLRVDVPVNPFTQYPIIQSYDSNKVSFSSYQNAYFVQDLYSQISPQSTISQISPQSLNEGRNVGVTHSRKEKDPLEQLNEDLGLLKKPVQTPQLSLQEMRRQAQK
eukprot:TRINITY_DN900_c1_g1_i1.p1 TRINITY_DN900_c1_g1~~TRINITY_DN900_c1_g1_i1.p1  ORF type:complete len:845 (+),score=66.94 TRINITY_DN900_c1_g1_i1:314-2536(+)